MQLNLHKKGTLPSNMVQNPKNDRYCMVVITQNGKQTIDPPMLIVDNELREEIVESTTPSELEMSRPKMLWEKMW